MNIKNKAFKNEAYDFMLCINFVGQFTFVLWYA